MGKKKKKQKHEVFAKVEVPARLRRFLAHPVVADVVAAGLMALANALKENRSVREVASNVKDKAENVASEAASEAGEAGTEAAEFGAILAAKAKEQARRLGAAYLGADDDGGRGGSGNGSGKGRAS